MPADLLRASDPQEGKHSSKRAHLPVCLAGLGFMRGPLEMVLVCETGQGESAVRPQQMPAAAFPAAQDTSMGLGLGRCLERGRSWLEARGLSS